jgi:hypothetical protein
MVVTTYHLLLLRSHLLCLLFSTVGCILVLVVVLESYRRRHLPLFSVFDRSMMATWSSSLPLYMESPV